MCNINGLRVESNHHLELKQTLELFDMMYRLKSGGWREFSEVTKAVQVVEEQSWVHIPSSPDFWRLLEPIYVLLYKVWQPAIILEAILNEAKLSN